MSEERKIESIPDTVDLGDGEGVTFKKNVFTGRTSVVPTVAVTKLLSLVLNPEAARQVGADKKFVILVWDEKNKRVGLWFWKDRPEGSSGRSAYAVSNASQGNKKITCRGFTDQYHLRELADAVGRCSFPLRPVPTKKDLWVADIR